MASNLYVYDHFRNPLVQVVADTNPRGYVWNDVGRCEFSLPTNDAKFKERNVRYGNLLRVEHIASASGHGKLQDWLGIILPRRTWNTGIVNLTAYSMEALLTKRPMPWVSIKGTPKQMFLKILEYAAAVDSNIVIQPGVVEDVDKELSDDLRNSAYIHIVNLVKRSGMSWSVTGEVGTNGQLVLYANLTNSSGQDTGLVLNDINSQLHSPIMVEDGQPTNVTVAQSFEVTARQRHTYSAVNEKALALYGYFGENKVITGIHDPSALRYVAQLSVDETANPRKLMNRTIIDVGNTYSYCNRGNFVELDEHYAGFLPDGSIGTKGKARIRSMDYYDGDNKIITNLEVMQ